MQPVFLQRVPGTQRKWYMHNKYVRWEYEARSIV
jgi:hypothetical protein